MLPINPARIPALYAETRQLQSAGRLDEARAGYRRILAVRPDLAEAHFQLGDIALAQGDAAAALDHCRDALKFKPREVAIWRLAALAAQKLGDAEKSAALLALAKAARLDRPVLLQIQDWLGGTRARPRAATGTAPPADVKRAVALMQRGAFAEAERLARRLIAAHAGVSLLWDIRAGAEAAQGKLDAAGTSWKTAVSLDPANAQARMRLGRLLLDQGEGDAALQMLRAAVELAPRDAEALMHLGAALERAGRTDAAAQALTRALKEQSGLTPATRGLARLRLAARRYGEAEALARPLAARGDAEALATLAEALAGQGDETGALAAYDRAIAARPGLTRLKAEKARLLQRFGRFPEAESLFRDAIAEEPHDARHAHVFMVTHKAQADDPLLPQMEARFEDPATSDEARIYLGFGLAKAMEDIGAYDRVFHYLRPANALMRQRQPWDAEAHRRDLDALMAAFDTADFDRRIEGASDFAPIFVTGLPRSGTTLVEQVLASHSAVTGGGELGIARSLATAALALPDRIRSTDELDDAAIADIGQRTEREMRALFPDADAITDKGVQSWNLFGPIRLALPRARLVLVERDPRDTLFSMYRNLFEPGQHRHAYSLTDLATYYRRYREITDFWQQRLAGAIHVIRYEDLVADPEQETRRLIAACGLPWEDACLTPHQTRRRVDTLSLAQVRRPIYSSSLRSWQRHEDDLAELFQALETAPTGK